MEHIEINTIHDLPMEGRRKLIMIGIGGMAIFVLGILLSIINRDISSFLLFSAFSIIVFLYAYYIFYRAKQRGLIKANFVIEKKRGYVEKVFDKIKPLKPLFDFYAGTPTFILLKEIEHEGQLYKVRVNVCVSANEFKSYDVNDEISVIYYMDDMKLIKENEYNLINYYSISRF